MEEKLTYFEIFEQLERALPSTTELNYTELTPYELWKRIENFFDETKVKISDEFLKELKSRVMFKGGMLYQKQFGWNRVFFDQNDYKVKRVINKIKLEIIVEIIEKNFEKSISSDLGYTKEIFGDEEKIKKHISKEKIKKYVSDMFTITAGENDAITSNQISYSNILEIIFTYYGISFGKENDKQISDFFDLIKKSEREAFTSFSHTDRMSEYNEFSQGIYDIAIKRVVAQITEYIHSRCNDMLKKGIETNKKREERRQQDLQTKNQTHQEQQTEQIRTTSTIPKEEPISAEKPKEESSPSPEEQIDTLISSYEKLQALIERNKNISKQIYELDKQRKKIEQELERLQLELDGNKQQIIEEISRGR